jgi:hypothetical protein
MEYIDFVLWKALALVVAAFIYGLWRGLTGRPLGQARSDTDTGPEARD